MAMTITYEGSGLIRTIVAAWTSDSNGDASGTTRRISGRLIKGRTNPDAAAPTDNYDITLTDSQDSYDLLTKCQDNLADRDTANNEEVYFLILDDAGTPLAQSLHPVVDDAITITIANAGDTKGGVLRLYYEAA